MKYIHWNIYTYFKPAKASCRDWENISDIETNLTLAGQANAQRLSTVKIVIQIPLSVDNEIPKHSLSHMEMAASPNYFLVIDYKMSLIVCESTSFLFKYLGEALLPIFLYDLLCCPLCWINQMQLRSVTYNLDFTK